MYNLKLLTPEMMKLLGSSTKTEDENGENMPHLEITDIVLVHCNITNNGYQYDLRILYTFVSNKSFGQLFDILSKNFIFVKTFNFEFSLMDVWFTDQNCKTVRDRG